MHAIVVIGLLLADYCLFCMRSMCEYAHITFVLALFSIFAME